VYARGVADLDVLGNLLPESRTRPNRTFGAPAEFDSDLDVLEYRYASDPRFIDRTAHILLLIGER
jgi:hypothetical protein